MCNLTRVLSLSASGLVSPNSFAKAKLVNANRQIKAKRFLSSEIILEEAMIITTGKTERWQLVNALAISGPFYCVDFRSWRFKIFSRHIHPRNETEQDFKDKGQIQWWISPSQCRAKIVSFLRSSSLRETEKKKTFSQQFCKPMGCALICFQKKNSVLDLSLQERRMLRSVWRYQEETKCQSYCNWFHI